MKKLIMLAVVIGLLVTVNAFGSNQYEYGDDVSQSPNFNSSWDNHDTFLSPYHDDAYGPGINSDATGRPFKWETQDGQTPPPESKVEPNGYGLGVGKDEFGRPVKPEPAW